jgi:D-xylose transport system permease protein
MSVQTATPPAPAEEFAADHGYGVASAWNDYWERVRGGDVGALPAVLGLLALVVLFSIWAGDKFFSAANFANLLNQGAAIITIAMGLVFVLLLGEIDLSAGWTAGTSGAILAVTLSQRGWPWPLSVVACLATGALIGLFIGLLVARLRIPSFVVTLALFLALQGLMLQIIGQGGTITVTDDVILKLMNNNMSVVAGWILFLIVVGSYALITYLRLGRRRRRGLPTASLGLWATRVLALAVILGIPTYILNQERSRNVGLVSIKGIPYIVPVILVLLLALTFLLDRTRLGKHIYAVGGNAEAARRAGISVPGVRIFCFILCSVMAAIAGIMLVSRDNSVSPSSGGGQTLLLAVGAAVIGGTSLFGGRGKVRDAIIGGLVVAVINNALPLVTQDAGIVYEVTGLVLLVAASVDAISRRRATSSGLA